MNQIADLFALEVDRKIEEVIKVDQTNEEIIRGELKEYVVTDAIARHQHQILDRYLETKSKPHEGTAVWVSGFFGSGKSSFAKMVGLALANREVCGDGAAALLGHQVKDARVKQLLRLIPENIPTKAVIFDVSTDRGIRAGNQSLTEIMYRAMLRDLGYAKDLDLAELEITLEGDGRLAEFQAKFAELYKGRDWDREKGKVALAIGQASRVMHALDPETYETRDSWKLGVRGRADINPGDLAKRCLQLMDRRGNGANLVFVIDEVGQFVAQNVQKMLDLQAVVQSLGREGQGRLWIMVTSQEKLTDLVGGLDGKTVELARLMDRFPLKVHLEPSDISEVTSKRVLAKNADAEKALRTLFTAHRGRLLTHTRVHTPNIKLPELSAESFIDLYPLLPYQIDLIINVVSGLRTQGGASKHVGGANRTIIKLAQQLLIHPDVAVAQQPVGSLVTLDRVYDLVAGNISSEVRQKIDRIRRTVDHPLAAPVAKTICLLQYVQSIPRTAENIAASLHPAVEADSRLPEVREALSRLVAALQVREGDDGYRIPTPAEDDWEQQRSRLEPKRGDVERIHAELVGGLWQPQPSHTLESVKPFKAGLYFNTRLLTNGDIPVHITFTEDEAEQKRMLDDWRSRSQTKRKDLFWVARVDAAVTRATEEVFRSAEVLARKERTATTRDASALVSEEKRRERRHRDELRGLLKRALLAGTIYFRGNDRSPDAHAGDVSRAASRALGTALPEVFHRFHEAAARVSNKDLDALLKTENLRGLPSVFSQLLLVREERGKPVFRTDAGPLVEVFNRIADRHQYGETLSGRSLADHFAGEPFGWDFDVVRLLVACLLRAGQIEAVSKGQVIDNALSIESRNTLPNNNLFRQATFRPKESLDFAKVVEAFEHFQEVFGKEISELEQGVVARAIKDESANREDSLQSVHTTLVTHGLPGAGVLSDALDQLRVIRSGSEENAILTFNGCWGELKEAIKRASELNDALTDPALDGLAKARTVTRRDWPFLERESELPDGLADKATELIDLLDRETFFRELAGIDQLHRDISNEYKARFGQAVDARSTAYREALDSLRATPGWTDLSADQQERVSRPLSAPLGQTPSESTPIPQIRAETEACESRLAKAIREMLCMLEGNRLVQVQARAFFSGGIETPEQLEQALQGLRDECERWIGAGKKVLVQ